MGVYDGEYMVWSEEYEYGVKSSRYMIRRAGDKIRGYLSDTPPTSILRALAQRPVPHASTSARRES